MNAIPAQGTLFKTSKMKLIDMSWASDTAVNRLRDQKVRFVKTLNFTGGDVFLVQYEGGVNDKKMACFLSTELTKVRDTGAGNKRIELMLHSFDCEKNKIKTYPYKKVLLTASNEIKLIQKVKKLKQAHLFCEVVGFNGLSQKNVQQMIAKFNREFYTAKKYMLNQ